MFLLYIDEDSGDRSLVQALRARGVDVITAQEAGMIERTDDEQLQLAASRNRVLNSFNRGDFLRLHRQYTAEGKAHAGILLAPAALLAGRADAPDTQGDGGQIGCGHARLCRVPQCVGLTLPGFGGPGSVEHKMRIAECCPTRHQISKASAPSVESRCREPATLSPMRSQAASEHLFHASTLASPLPGNPRTVRGRHPPSSPVMTPSWAGGR